MTESMDALTTKLEGFDAMMQKILDKVTGLEAWKTAADASMDKFTKYAHFLPFSHSFTALSVAQLYFHNVYKLHGLPETIISDRASSQVFLTLS